MACKDEVWGIKKELREAERDQQRVGFFFQKKKKNRFQKYNIYMTWPTQHRPEPKNNLKLRPKTRLEYSQARPKPVKSGWLSFRSVGSIAQSYLFRNQFDNY